jgi:hypothetical protein
VQSHRNLLPQMPVQEGYNEKRKTALEGNQTHRTRGGKGKIKNRLGKPFMIDPYLIAGQV